MFVLAVIFGGGWALIPGYLRQRFRVNELVSSLLLNYIAFFLIVYSSVTQCSVTKRSE